MDRSRSAMMCSTRAAVTESSKSRRTAASTSLGPRCMVRMAYTRRIAQLWAASASISLRIPSTISLLAASPISRLFVSTLIKVATAGAHGEQDYGHHEAPEIELLAIAEGVEGISRTARPLYAQQQQGLVAG